LIAVQRVVEASDRIRVRPATGTEQVPEILRGRRGEPRISVELAGAPQPGAITAQDPGSVVGGSRYRRESGIRLRDFLCRSGRPSGELRLARGQRNAYHPGRRARL